MRRLFVLLAIVGFLISGSLAVASTPLIPFPSGHTKNSISETFTSGRDWHRDDIFDIYVWREGGYVWVEIVPISVDPFICPLFDFLIIQEDILYDKIKFEDSLDVYLCGDVSILSIFRLTYWSYGGHLVDLSQAFTLVYDGDVYYSLHIPAKTETNPYCNEPHLYGFGLAQRDQDNDDSDSGCFISTI